MSPRLPALLALTIVVCAAAPASAQKPRYTLVVTEHTDKKTGTFTSTQTLRNRRTGRIIWVRHFSEIDNITWSSDHRAVMFRIYTTPQERARHPFGIKLVTWVADGSIQTFFPYPEVPDDKYVLLKTGSSGDNDMGHGGLTCVSIRTRRSLSVAPEVRRVKWVQDHRIQYWEVYLFHGSGGFLSEEERPNPRFWQVPKGF